MATNRDLLKEAIADAKAVKETAIANAKAALEEAFTPQVREMFAAKLQEMESEEDEIMKEDGFEKMDAEDGDDGFDSLKGNIPEAEDDMTNELDLEELLRELEEEEGVEEALNEAEEEEEEEDMEMSDEESEDEEEEGEPLDLEDMTDEDLKSMIEDVIKDMIEAGELEAGHEGEEGEEEAEEETGIEDEEEVDLAELLREIEEMEEMKEPVDELFGIKSRAVRDFEKANPGLLDKVKSAQDEKSKISMMKDAMDKFRADYIRDTKSPGVANAAVARVWEYVGVEPATIPSSSGDTAAGMLGQRESMEPELAEALKTIEALKSELNEINLLNAKLLYTNKIFKAKNLNENQKVKVLSSFDKATTVGEVKIVFETLNEGIKVNKNTIKENLGSASKAMVTPNAKKPIVESNEAFARMQKLAGII